MQPDPRAPPGALAFAARVVVVAAALAVIQFVAPALGMRWQIGVSAAWLAAAVVALALPRHRFSVVCAAGLVVLIQWAPLRYAGYHLLLAALAIGLRRRPVGLAVTLGLGVFVIPKELFRNFYHQPYLHDWVNPFLLAHLLLVTALAWAERARGRVGDAPPAEWWSLYLFPTQALNPMNFGPTHLWEASMSTMRDIVAGSALVAAKAGAVLGLVCLFPSAPFARNDAASLGALSWPALWGIVVFNYLIHALTLSGTADVAVAVARTLGWRLPTAFRFALLAWNPVELWRRWAIYNRKLLLTLVYYPLGGNRRRRYFNVLCTFLASGVVLHTGWFGSKYWAAGAAGWRDQTVYFLAQGLAVCACLWFWTLRGKDPGADRNLRLSAVRVGCTLATQAFSAWVHVIVLAPQVDWWARWRLMARCLGLPL